MENNIDRALASAAGIQLMTHVVAGYPNLDVNADLIRLMAKRGVKLIEIQIPFTDPLADLAVASLIINTLKALVAGDSCYAGIYREFL